MPNETPFFLTKIECPICKTINEFETIKVGSYFENGRDTDFCPQDITWKYSRYQSYNPLVYFTAVCSNCYYAREFNNSFKEWKNDNTFRAYKLKTIKDNHLDQLAQADSVIRTLGEAIDVSRYPNESGIIKLHLAIIDELLAGRVTNLDLGRFYLRVGWIFRDMNNGENPQENFLNGLLLEIENKFSSYRGELEDSRNSLEKYVSLLNAHFESDSLTNDIKSIIYPYKEKFAEKITQLEKSLQEIEARSEDYTQLFNEYRSAAVGGESTPGGMMQFGNFHSFKEFLNNLKQKNSNIVTNEKEALVKAIHYYKEAFAGGREITPGNQQIQASYLIAELSRRVQDYDGAKEYFNSTIKSGQEYIYQNRNDRSRTALARKILELAIEQGKENMSALKGKK